MLALLVVLAAAPINAGNDAKCLGWSSDGEAVAWSEVLTGTSPVHRWFEKTGKQAEVPLAKVMKMTLQQRAALREEVQEIQDASDDFQVDDRATVITVHDVHTGAEKKFLTAYEALTPQAEGPKQKRFATMADAAAWDAWKKDAGLFVQQGLAGPRAAKAVITVGSEATATWDAEDQVKVTFALTRGADRSSTSFDDQMFAMFVPHRSTTVWWERTGRRAAFCIETAAARTMRGEVRPSLEIHVVTAPPRVEVLASARLKDEGDRVAALVEKAGFAVSVVGVATKDRNATVIYADAKHAEDAKALAAAIPGATVDKLTWKANGELVVAVGR